MEPITKTLDADETASTERARLAVAAIGDLLTPLLELPYKSAKRVLLEEFEARYLRHVLAQTGGNVRQASFAARMDRSYLNDLLKRHRIR